MYYGMEQVRDTAVRDRMGMLLQSAGVFDHGRQPVGVISEEKHRSSFHLYYTNSVVETDCISIKESAVAGCIPIVSGMNVFAERSGVMMPGDATSEADYIQAAEAFVGWVQTIRETELEKIRDSLRQVRSHRDWEETAGLWVKELELVVASVRWGDLRSISHSLSSTANKEPGDYGEKGSKPVNTVASIVYINLASSVERERSIRSQLHRSCPSGLIDRFDAIAGNIYPFTETDKRLFQDCDFKQSRCALGLMGNALSHCKIWQRMASLNDNEVAVIIQDDALLISNFMHHATAIAE